MKEEGQQVKVLRKEQLLKDNIEGKENKTKSNSRQLEERDKKY